MQPWLWKCKGARSGQGEPACKGRPAAAAQGRKNHCVAVIGDGAITGGMAYEAMNHAGFLDKNMIVVLNDNQQVRRAAPADRVSRHPLCRKLVESPAMQQ